MDRSILVRLFGFPATLVHGDPMVLDRWLWLRRHLPAATPDARLLDVGCGSGAFTIGAARRGYRALGLSWDDRNSSVARRRAELCDAPTAEFRTADIRSLDSHPELAGRFDVAICLETIEHILDDKKLLTDIAACLRPGGRLLLTSPSMDFKPLNREDGGPYLPIEDGRHVRKGYDDAGLRRLCEHAGLVCDRISSCSGFLSQKITTLNGFLAKAHTGLAWATILPLRPLPIVADRIVTRLLGWPAYSICLQAHRPED